MVGREGTRCRKGACRCRTRRTVRGAELPCGRPFDTHGPGTARVVAGGPAALPRASAHAIPSRFRQEAWKRSPPETGALPAASSAYPHCASRSARFSCSPRAFSTANAAFATVPCATPCWAAACRCERLAVERQRARSTPLSASAAALAFIDAGEESAGGHHDWLGLHLALLLRRRRRGRPPNPPLVPEYADGACRARRAPRAG